MQNLQTSWDVSFPAALAKYLVLNLKFEVVLLHFFAKWFLWETICSITAIQCPSDRPQYGKSVISLRSLHIYFLLKYLHLCFEFRKSFLHLCKQVLYHRLLLTFFPVHSQLAKALRFFSKRRECPRIAPKICGAAVACFTDCVMSA